MRKIILMNYCIDILLFELLVLEINKRLLIILPITSSTKKAIKKEVINNLINNEKKSKIRVFSKKAEKEFRFNNHEEMIQYLMNILNADNSNYIDLYEINLNNNYNVSKTFLNSGHFRIFFEKHNVEFISVFKEIKKINDFINEKSRGNQLRDFMAMSYINLIKFWKVSFRFILPNFPFKEFFLEMKILSQKKNISNKEIILDFIIDLLISLFFIILFNYSLTVFYPEHFLLHYQKYLSLSEISIPDFLLKSFNNMILGFKILYITIFFINYRLLISFIADQIKILLFLIQFSTKLFSFVLNFIKMKLRDFYLLLNDLSYSPKIKVS